MCSRNSDKFYYYYYSSCSYDQLCGKSILFFSRRCSVGNTDRYSGWNLFIHCRINDQCGNRCNHSELKHCRNLYGYLYNGCSGRMCCSDSNDFGYHNHITCSYNQLCGKSILFFSCRCSVCNTDGYSGWNLFFDSRINDQCGNRSDHSELKHCGNLYGYLYNGCGGRMCCPDSDDFRYYYCFAGSNI